jgi:hypothetical protein
MLFAICYKTHDRRSHETHVSVVLVAVRAICSYLCLKPEVTSNILVLPGCLY